jgi:hypothetical protein
MSKEDGGPAFPQPFWDTGSGAGIVTADEVEAGGMPLRDWFAATIQYDKELMEDVSRCDDQDLVERFGLESEKDEYFDFVGPEGAMPFKNIELRIKLEARARAHIRYIEADAMIAERNK